MFDWEEDENIVIVLRILGYTKLSQLLFLDSSTLQNLMFIKDSKEYIPLGSDISLIKCFQCFIMSKSETNDIDNNNYIKIDYDDFDNFRISDYMPTFIIPSSTTGVNPKSTFSSSYFYSFTPTYAFKKGIKLNPTLFPNFKDSKFWDNFK